MSKEKRLAEEDIERIYNIALNKCKTNNPINSDDMRESWIDMN